LNSDFNAVVDRSSLEATYNQIVKDLKDASGLLPDILPGNMLYKARPTRAACYGMLAKVYLQTSRFQKALESASQSVGLYDYLLDFNDKSVVDSTSASPIQKFNAEVIFYATVASPVNALSFASVDTTIYRSFDSIDLRKPVYFSSRPDGTKFFKGSYNGGSSDLFQGIAVDEMYLIRAECNARLNNADEALNDLNKLLIKRWKKGKYTPYASLSAEQALAIILAERKKELLYRGTRWADLKRLNKEPAKAIVLRRVLQGTEYVLQPNDLRYAFLIPREVITKSSITQNKR
jgi:tetratricopeptide (TPR) repeat protein